MAGRGLHSRAAPARRTRAHRAAGGELPLPSAAPAHCRGAHGGEDGRAFLGRAAAPTTIPRSRAR